jgi:outer membrane biosynthesis protein TonB
MPRGLAAAILAMYPVTMIADSVGHITPYAYWTLYNQFAVFPQIAFVVIIASIVFTAIGVRVTTKDVRVGGDEDEDEEDILARKQAEAAHAAADKRVVQKVIENRQKTPAKKEEAHPGKATHKKEEKPPNKEPHVQKKAPPKEEEPEEKEGPEEGEVDEEGPEENEEEER